MGGKAALLLVMGFSLIFLVFGQRFGDLSNRAVDNMVNYYDETVAHDCAVSGANIAANKIFFDPTWNAGYSNLDFNGGKVDVSVAVIDPFQNIIQITSVGTYDTTHSIVKTVLQPSKFSKFAYYSVSEGGSIWWTFADTVWGPFHTQDYLRSYRHPTFMGKASSKKKLIYYDSKRWDKPIFNGGYQNGVDLPLPTDGVSQLQAAAASGGFVFNPSDYTASNTVYLTFAGDSIKYKFSSSGPVTTVLATDLAPNGAIFIPNATLYLEGVVKGQYTVGVSGSSGSKGSVILQDDITYNTNPKTTSNATDLLGIVAQNNVLIDENTANNNDININASIYCENGGFGAENYSGRPVSGDINLLGGIIQNTRQAVGTFSSGSINHGFAKKYKYDDRLLLSSPPFFPGTGEFEVVSWLEE